MKRAVFLDRDGVLNRAIVREGRPFSPSSLAELEILPEAAACLTELKRLGFLLVVVTNQPDVGRGTLAPGAVEGMHAALRAQLPVDDILCCFHDDAAGCECRKPRPGLLHEAARRYGIDLAGSFLIGDRWRDIEAGAAAGCRTIWIDYGYKERKPGVQADARVASLEEAVGWIGRVYYNMYIHRRYEWDEEKNRRNQRKHAGISFEMAALVFEDKRCLVCRDRIDDDTGEQRWLALGMAQPAPDAAILLVVAHVYREDDHGEEVIRIISAREAEKRDIRRYQAQGLDEG